LCRRDYLSEAVSSTPNWLVQLEDGSTHYPPAPFFAWTLRSSIRRLDGPGRVDEGTIQASVSRMALRATFRFPYLILLTVWVALIRQCPQARMEFHIVCIPSVLKAQQVFSACCDRREMHSCICIISCFFSWLCNNSGQLALRSSAGVGRTAVAWALDEKPRGGASERTVIDRPFASIGLLSSEESRSA
jgi:hypothetical protein